MLEHGGKIRQAATRYGIPVEDWLDLSTGINPDGWPVPAIPAACWARLPEDDDGLVQAARDYYGAEHLLPVAGSQAAIQILPRVRPPCRVAVLDPAYAEHACAWRRESHEVTAVTAERLNEVVQYSDVLVLIHPNNPTGTRFPVEQLLHWHARLAARGGWLVVDEAFMDVTPEHSLCRHSACEGLIVLRSLGKFFGLAGARVGFVCAQASLLARMQGVLGPWSVSAPARWVATSALADHVWQNAARRRLGTDGVRLQALLTQHSLSPTGGCALFQWVCTQDAQDLHETLARHGILTRLLTETSSLRFGLPGNDMAWARLDAALSSASVLHSAEVFL